MTPPEGSMPNERFMILQMVQDGTISPDEGARLLETVDRLERTRPIPEAPAPPQPSKTVHIVVRNSKGDQEIDLNLPVALVDIGLNVISRFAGDRIAEVPNIRRIAESGFTGKLVDINHGSDRIEISLE